MTRALALPQSTRRTRAAADKPAARGKAPTATTKPLTTSPYDVSKAVLHARATAMANRALEAAAGGDAIVRGKPPRLEPDGPAFRIVMEGAAVVGKDGLRREFDEASIELVTPLEGKPYEQVRLFLKTVGTRESGGVAVTLNDGKLAERTVERFRSPLQAAPVATLTERMQAVAKSVGPLLVRELGGKALDSLDVKLDRKDLEPSALVQASGGWGYGAPNRRAEVPTSAVGMTVTAVIDGAKYTLRGAVEVDQQGRAVAASLSHPKPKTDTEHQPYTYELFYEKESGWRTDRRYWTYDT